MRCVIDANVLISALLIPNSLPRKALELAVEAGTLLCSEATVREVADVLSREKFDRYVTPHEREAFLRALIESCELVDVTHTVRASRDPGDDKYLAVAISGRADCIVTGDADLLAMDPYEGVSISTPATFLRAWPDD